MNCHRMSNIEQGISNYEVFLPTSTFNIPGSIFEINSPYLKMQHNANIIPLLLGVQGWISRIYLYLYLLLRNLCLCKFNEVDDGSFGRTNIAATTALLAFHYATFLRQVELLCLTYNA